MDKLTAGGGVAVANTYLNFRNYKPLAVFSCIALVSCGGSGLGDPFEYSSKKDEFDGSLLSQATAKLSADVDKDALIEISVTCKVTAGATADPFRDTTLEFVVVDGKGQPKDFTDYTLKFDDGTPGAISYFEKNNISEYSNVSKQYYVKILPLMLSKEMRNQYFIPFTELFHVPDQERAYYLVDKALNAKALMVRYETDGGLVNTNTVSIDGPNFRKVLEDCGWQKWYDNYNKNKMIPVKEKSGSFVNNNETKVDWNSVEESPNAVRNLIELYEGESLGKYRIALVKLDQKSNEEWDSVLTYNANSTSCGTAGCSLDVYFYGAGGEPRNVLSIQTGSGLDSIGVKLGSNFTDGMRNLVINDSVTWTWNGAGYETN